MVGRQQAGGHELVLLYGTHILLLGQTHLMVPAQIITCILHEDKVKIKVKYSIELMCYRFRQSLKRTHILKVIYHKEKRSYYSIYKFHIKRP